MLGLSSTIPFKDVRPPIPQINKTGANKKIEVTKETKALLFSDPGASNIKTENIPRKALGNTNAK